MSKIIIEDCLSFGNGRDGYNIGLREGSELQFKRNERDGFNIKNIPDDVFGQWMQEHPEQAEKFFQVAASHLKEGKDTKEAVNTASNQTNVHGWLSSNRIDAAKFMLAAADFVAKHWDKIRGLFGP